MNDHLWGESWEFRYLGPAHGLSTRYRCQLVVETVKLGESTHTACCVEVGSLGLPGLQGCSIARRTVLEQHHGLRASWLLRAANVWSRLRKFCRAGRYVHMMFSALLGTSQRSRKGSRRKTNKGAARDDVTLPVHLDSRYAYLVIDPERDQRCPKGEQRLVQ